MRLLTLDLDRYGPFTGRQLAFRSDARLHVILGPNEAGKSCALAAVTDLLFGIEERTRYDFLHREDGLRLGAEISARDGRCLSFYRRKGRKKVLSDPAGAILPDDALLPFLGGLSRAVFCNAFGMNAKVLRDGANEMLKSDGEIGASLFAAASGLRGFRDAARALEAEANAIYAPRGQKPLLNQALSAYDTARREANSERIGPEAWRKLEKAITEAEAFLEKIGARRKAIASELNRLKRIKSVRPILAILDSLEEDAKRFSSLPAMEEADVVEFAKRVRGSTATTEAVRLTEAALKRTEADLNNVLLDGIIEPHHFAIEKLIENKGDYLKLVSQLPRVEREVEDFDRTLLSIAKELGLANAGEVEAKQPTAMARAHIKSLITQGRDMSAERGRQARDYARLTREHSGFCRIRDERGKVSDPTPFDGLYDLVRPIVAKIDQQTSLKAEIEKERGDLDNSLQRLRPPVASFSTFASAPMPSAEVIQQHNEALDEQSGLRNRAADSITKAKTSLAELDKLMAARETAGPIPDPVVLKETRESRDAAWQAIRQAAFHAAGALEGAVLLDQAAIFERMNVKADELADRLILDAQRAADQAADLRRYQELGQDLADAQTDLAQSETAIVSATDAWSSIWAPFGITPSRPAKMQEWRSTALALIKRWDEHNLQRRKLVTLEEYIDKARAPLEHLAALLGLDSIEGLDISLLNRQVTARLKVMKDGFDAVRDAMTRIQTANESISELEAEMKASAEAEAAWRGDWCHAITALSLPENISLDAAEAALAAWGEVPGQLKERENRRGRVTGIRRDMAAYEADVRNVMNSIECDIDKPIPEIVQYLQTRARTARDASISRESHESLKREANKAYLEAQEAAQRADQSLGEFTTRFAIDTKVDVVSLASRLEHLVRHNSRTRDVQDELARAADGSDEAMLRKEIEAIAADEIEGQLIMLNAEDEQLDHNGKVTYAELDRLRAERNRLEGGTGCELAAARKNATEAQIRAAARRYVVMKLGALLLGSAIEMRRAEHQDPLLQRAGDLFQGLTGNAYTGLEQAFNASDEPVLKGVRQRGEPVAISDMSEGTQDQLFLALRLAYLEEFARGAEPAPFLGDDIFTSFDDARTGHGLEALAAIGSQVQTILFTHHENVAHLAAQRLGTRADIISLS